MRIIITGACGHIGSFVSNKIHKIKKLKELILIDNFSSQRYFSIFNIPNKVKTKFYEIDISKKDSLNRFKKTDYLIHCASYTNAEGSFNIKKEMFRNNLDCMKNVINYCKKFKPTKGCIAIKKKDFIKILPLITKKTKLFIY